MSERKALQRVDAGMGNKPALIVVDVVKGFTDPPARLVQKPKRLSPPTPH